MKKVISGKELIEVEKEAINLLCNTVSETLGPTGNNIIINSSDTSPYITNDGVTIASNIESEDKRINTVLELIKEASLKTNELVGDGTTTTLVLLESIFNLGIEKIEQGKNKIILKNELLSIQEEVLELLEKQSKKTTDKDLFSISYTSTNSNEIATITTEVFKKVKNKYSILIEEGEEETTYEKKEGYNINISNMKSIYFNEEERIDLKDVYLFIVKGYLDNLEQISDIVNLSQIENKNIVIITEGVSEDIKNELYIYYKNKNNIFIVELEETGSFREKIEIDIKVLANCTIKNIDYEELNISDGGIIDSISIRKDEIIIFSKKDNRNKLLSLLEEELKNCKSDYEKDFILSRISKIQEGIITIYVGGVTKTEKKEKIMRYNDAINALHSTSKGITLGEGVPFLLISKELSKTSDGVEIIKKSLEKPFDKIMDNLGLDKDLIKENIINNNYNKVYNYKNNEYELYKETSIKDPILVLEVAFKNALSIASLLLSTSSLVINLEEKEREIML